MLHRAPPLTVSLVLGLAVGACAAERQSNGIIDPKADASVRGDAGVAPVDAGGGGGGGADAGAVVGVDSGPVARDPGCPPSARWLLSMSGRVIDPSGAPLPEARAQVCLRLAPNDQLICLRPGSATADGRFTVPISEDARCVDEATMRVLVPSTHRATTYCHAELPPGVADVAVDAPYVLFPTVAAPNLPPVGNDREARDVTFADGLLLRDLVPYDFFAEYAELAAARVDPASPGLCFLSGSPPLEQLWAFSPEGTISAPGVAVRIPNSTNLPAGTRVRLFVLGGLGCATPGGDEIAEAEWREFGTGTVDSTGAFIDSDAGSGLTCVTWLGIVRM